jgi:hypothetical protein
MLEKMYEEILMSAETRDPRKMLEVMLNLLTDFPCEDMQRLVALVRKNAGGDVRVVADEGGNIASLSYVLGEDDGSGSAAFLVPHRRVLKRRFESKVRENIPLEWGAVVCAASHICDYGAYASSTDTKLQQMKAERLEAIFLRSLYALHKGEGVEWKWRLSPFQMDVLRRF